MTSLSEQRERRENPYYVTALARGLAILGSFTSTQRELSLKNMADILNVSQSSALRIAFTLETEGFLVRDPQTKLYRVGPRTVSVGLEAVGAMTLPEICAPYVAALRDATNETVKIGIPVQDEVVIVGIELPRQVERLFSTTWYIGFRRPLYSGSLGRAILAWSPTDWVDLVLERADFAASVAKPLSRQEIIDELQATRMRGYSLNDREVSGDNRAVGAPLIGPSHRVVGAINLSVPAHRGEMEELVSKYAPLVVETAREISAVLPPHVLGAGPS